MRSTRAASGWIRPAAARRTPPRGRRRRRPGAAPRPDHRVQDGFERVLAGSANTAAHAVAVQSAVGVIMSAPKAAARPAMAAPPGSVSARAMASVSTRWRRSRPAPRHGALAAADAAGQADAPHAADVGLRPNPSSSSTVAARSAARPRRRRPGRGRRARSGLRAGCRCTSSDADDAPRPTPSGRWAGWPATQPGAQGGQQLEVAEAHAFLAGGQLEQPVHRPQRQ
jgi:hypothetical protein